MVTTHYHYSPASVSIHTVIDDYGNEHNLSSAENIGRFKAWAMAFRFANGQTFEEAGMHSINAVVAEH